jgi:hypothetical protein
MLRGVLTIPLMPASASDPTAPATGPTAPSASAEAGHLSPPSSAALSFSVGDPVQLRQRPRYLKSADPMPMLRPPDLVDDREAGVVMELRPQGHYAVRFRRGTYLIEGGLLQIAADGEAGPLGG